MMQKQDRDKDRPDQPSAMIRTETGKNRIADVLVQKIKRISQPTDAGRDSRTNGKRRQHYAKGNAGNSYRPN